MRMNDCTEKQVGVPEPQRDPSRTGETKAGAVRTLIRVRPNIDAIPSELKRLKAAVWRGEIKPNGKVNKAPRSPSTGHMIGADKPHLWGSFEEAERAYRAGGWDGIGVLMQPEVGLVGIDLDDIKALRGSEPGVNNLLAHALNEGIYTEGSPSGRGLRLFVRGSLPGDKGRKKGGIELYNKDRFLTVTGAAVWPGEITDAQWFIDGLLELITAPTDNHVVVDEMKPELPADDAVVKKLSAWCADAEPGLWGGDWRGTGGDLGGGVRQYPSQSEADMALVGIIVREAVKLGVPEGALPDTVMQVFELSGLYRPEKHQQVEKYAVPKAINSAYHAAAAVTSDPVVATLAAGEPGDIVAGRIFAQISREKLLYVKQAGTWLQWDAVRWAWCYTGEEMRAAKFIADKILNHASRMYAQDPEKHKRRMAFAMRLQNLNRLDAMVELAKSEDGMTVGHMTDLDSDPWLLGVRNGVLELRSGALLAADPSMRITRQAAAAYDRGAQCPEWLKFLDQVFNGDAETVAFVRRALGYTLTGVTTEEVLFICYGGGANGKSVFGNVVGHVLGDYSQSAPPSLLTVRMQGDAAPRNDIARLCGARLVQINELGQGDRLDEQVVKMLAGREKLAARFLHREFFEFQPTGKPWLRTNHRPVITGEDDGIWRRICLIPFHRKFAEHERDRWLESRLMAEADGILAWMVEGCIEWQKSGLKPSPLVRAESMTYRKESDLLGEFLDDETVVDKAARVATGTAYYQWETWCRSNGTHAGSKTSFTRKLKERGYIPIKSNGIRYYSGFRMRDGKAEPVNQ